MSQIIDWDRIARYVARESSPAERAEVERWLADDPTRQALLREVERRWTAAAPEKVDVDRAWARVAERIHDPSRHAVSEDVVLGDEASPSPARTFTLRRLALPVAAGLVLVAGVTYWLSDSSTSGTSVVAANEYVVPRGGAQRIVTLGDSTEVILASASRLVVAGDYGKESRSVDLEGEALFRVRHDATRPFRVRAGSVIAEDLGTEFVVRHVGVSEQSQVRIAVREGIVAVRAKNADDTLRARDVALASDSGVLVRHDQDLDAYFAWTRGQLVFDNTPLRDVAAELSRWFDLDISVDSSVANRVFSSPILTSTPIDEVLQIVGSGTDVRVERRGRVVRFSGPGYTGEIPVRAGPSREVAG